MAESFVEISGIFNVVAGVALLVYWYAFALFLPYRQLSTTLSILVENQNWTWINVLGVLGAMTGLLGQAGIFVAQIDHATWVASIGFFVASIGTMFLIGTMLWETILWPTLVGQNPALLDFDGPIYRKQDLSSLLCCLWCDLQFGVYLGRNRDRTIRGVTRGRRLAAWSRCTHIWFGVFVW